MKEILALLDLALVLVLGLHLLDQVLANPGHLVLVGIHLGQLVVQGLDTLLQVLDRLEQLHLDLVVACHLALGRLGLVRGGWCLGG